MMFFIRARSKWVAPADKHIAFKHADWRHRSVDVYVHHTADGGPRSMREADKIAYLRRIENFHQAPPRNYLAIGYSYLIFADGTVWEGRGFEAVGAHTLDPKDADHDGIYVENHDIGICLVGNTDRTKLTARQILAFKLLKQRLRAKGCRLDMQYPHRAAYATSCPGNNAMRQLKLSMKGTKA